ncbi:MAG: DUF192 domain-containing protein [Anaerolineae bacterium]|nr:DUF192 domain-containing protein [Anaerolineae bacterium]
MADWRVIRHAESGRVVLPRARWCDSFWCHFRGLMLRRHLPDDEGLLFVYGRESIAETSIHMFFVFFSIAAVWLDGDGRVVDAKLARPWRPYYGPSQPARYLVEARPALLEHVTVGDRLTFDDTAE